MGENLDARLAELEERIRKIEERLDQQAPTASSAPVKKTSAKEFLLTKSAKSEPQKLMVLAYYLERDSNVSSFNVADLEAVFRAAREKVPKNINDTVNKNIARGFLMEAKERKDSKKAWQLTSTGERFVEGELNGG